MSKVCLVTGGTGAIGSAIAKVMSKTGWIVIATCRPEKVGLIKELHKTLFEDSNNIFIYPVDVTCHKSCCSLVEKIVADFGVISALVNNAGITRDSSFRKMDVEHWRLVLSANLDSVFYLSNLVFPAMCDSGWGRIINIASINAQKGQFGQVNYSASKSGMLGFTKSLAQEGAKFGVTVNSVSPGYISTKMVTSLPESVVESIKNQIPMRRLGTVGEVAHSVAFLVADDSAFITGSNIAVNGGQHMF